MQRLLPVQVVIYLQVYTRLYGVSGKLTAQVLEANFSSTVRANRSSHDAKYAAEMQQLHSSISSLIHASSETASSTLASSPTRPRFPRKSRKQKPKLDGREQQVLSGKNKRVAARPREEAVVPARENLGKPSAQIYLRLSTAQTGTSAAIQFFSSLWRFGGENAVAIVGPGQQTPCRLFFFPHPAYFILFYSFLFLFFLV